MKKWLLVGLTVLVLLMNIVNLSGFGETHHTELFTRLTLCAVSLVLLISQQSGQSKVSVNGWICFFLLLISFALSATLSGAYSDMFNSLCYLLLTYIFSQIPADSRSLRWVGYVMLTVALSLLLVFRYTHYLSGWNPNTVAMLSFFSYTLYIATAVFRADEWERLLSLVASCVYLYFISSTSSRTSVLCTVLCIVATLIPDYAIRAVRMRGFRFVLLHSALLFAIVVILFENSDLISWLNEVNMAFFDKSLFNGREQIWKDGFEQFSTAPFFGAGEISVVNWHNWAISVLVPYGALGYLALTAVFWHLLSASEEYEEDSYVCGLSFAFLMILLQQSAELGLFGTENIHLIPYMLLGLLLGRITRIREVLS